MKTMLTEKQSEMLRAKGISADNASVKKPEYTSLGTPIGYTPIFTLVDLFAMLPKGIIYNGLSCKLRITSWYDEPYFAGYMNQVGEYIMGNPYDAPYSAEELIDVIFQLLCWAIDNRHVKLD